jgi:hypothetical protein
MLLLVGEPTLDTAFHKAVTRAATTFRRTFAEAERLTAEPSEAPTG